MKLNLLYFGVCTLTALLGCAQPRADEPSPVVKLITPARAWQNEALSARTPQADVMRAAHSNLVVLLHKPLVQPQQIRRYISDHSETDSPTYWVLAITQADAYWAWGKTNQSIRIWQDFADALPQLKKK